MKSSLLLWISLVMLCACAPFKFGDKRAGLCNQLNSDMIFRGSTSITRTAEIQHAEQPLTQHEYDRKCQP
jgi:hypothetical protein